MFEIYDLNKNVCRICLSDKGNDGFESVYVKDNINVLSELGLLYQDVFNLSIISEENHPQYLCNYCILQLRLFHKFKIKALESYNKFAELCCKLEKEETPDEALDADYNDDEIEIIFNPDDLHNTDNCYDVQSVDDLEDAIDDFEEVQYLEEEVEGPMNVVPEENSQEFCEKDSIAYKKKTKIKVEDEEFGTFECKRCSKIFKKKKLLDDHRRAEHPRLKYYCKLCPKVFYSEESLQVHTNIHNGLPAYKCEECGKEFKQKAHHIYHMLGHRNERNVQCHLCGKGFLNNSDLRIHLRVHNDERRYECDVCGKRFRAHTHMTNHRYSHFEKHLECPYCFQKYSSPNTIRTHIKAIHKGECPYECETCHRKFKRKHHLKAHYNTHKRNTTFLNNEPKVESVVFDS